MEYSTGLLRKYNAMSFGRKESVNHTNLPCGMRRLFVLLLLAMSGCSNKPATAEFREMTDRQNNQKLYAAVFYPVEGKREAYQISFSCSRGEPTFFSILSDTPVPRTNTAVLTYRVDNTPAKSLYGTVDGPVLWFEKDRAGSVVFADWSKGSKLVLNVAIDGKPIYGASFDVSALGSLLERLDNVCHP